MDDTGSANKNDDGSELSSSANKSDDSSKNANNSTSKGVKKTVTKKTVTKTIKKKTVVEDFDFEDHLDPIDEDGNPI